MRTEKVRLVTVNGLMKYIALVTILLVSNASLASGEFPAYMVGEWESLEKDDSGGSYHYTLLNLSENSGKLIQIFYLLEDEKEICTFKLDEKPIAGDIYHLAAEKCNGKSLKNKRAILLIPQYRNVLELKVFSYGSKNYRSELFSTYLNKVNNGMYLKESLTTHEKDH